MDKEKEPEKKIFPCFHQFELESGQKIAINSAYEIPSNEERVFNIAPFVLVGNPSPIEKQILPEAFCIDLLKTFPDLEKLKDRIVGSFAIEDISIKIKLIDMMFDRGWLKPRRDKTANFPFDKIPYFDTIAAFLKWVIKKIHSIFLGISKEDQKAVDRFDQQSRLLYYFLIQNNKVLIIFWKNFHPTIHIALDENRETKESLAFYFYTQGKGIGKPSNFLWEDMQAHLKQ